MITLIRKLFIKNYRDVDQEIVRLNHGKVASIFGIIINAILVSLKLTFGIIANSIALIGDAINNLSDVSSSLVTLIGFRLASKPADREHPFGHRRIEYIAGLIVSIIVIALAVSLLTTSIERIIASSISEYNLWTFIILGISILLKIFQFAIYFSFAKIIHSVALKATAIDSLGDILATAILLIGALIAYYFNLSLDGYLGIAIAIFIAINGIKLVKETASPLIGEALKKEDVDQIIAKIKNYPGVIGLHDILTHSYGRDKIFMSVHLEVDGHQDVFSLHRLIDKIEKDIKKEFNVELLIHMDPLDLSDEFMVKVEKEIINILLTINPDLKLHEFSLTRSGHQLMISFELLYPYSEKRKEEVITSLILGKLKGLHHEDIVLNISYERPYYLDE